MCAVCPAPGEPRGRHVLRAFGATLGGGEGAGRGTRRLLVQGVLCPRASRFLPGAVPHGQSPDESPSGGAGALGTLLARRWRLTSTEGRPLSTQGHRDRQAARPSGCSPVLQMSARRPGEAVLSDRSVACLTRVRLLQGLGAHPLWEGLLVLGPQ